MSTNSTFLPYAKQSISQEDIDAVSNALIQPAITRGPLVSEWERTIASFCEVTYAVAFSNATAALMAAYHAANAGPYDRVVTTPNSFIASVGPAIQRKATPVFVDIDRTTGNADLNQLLLNINVEQSQGKTIVVPVHFSGTPVNMQRIAAEIQSHKTIVIEDAAHAIGSCYLDGSPVGNCRWSDMTVFSFHPAKTLTTGEGGIVTTNNQELYQQLILYRNNGIETTPTHSAREERPGYYTVEFLSGNYNFTDIQAALGLSQFKRLGNFVEKRKQLVAKYRELLQGVNHIQMFNPDESLSIAHHLFIVQIDFKTYKKTKKEVMEELKKRGVGTQVHYIPIYQHPFFTKQYGEIGEYFPEMEKYYAQALSLPLYYDLTEEDVERVVKNLKETLAVS